MRGFAIVTCAFAIFIFALSFLSGQEVNRELFERLDEIVGADRHEIIWINDMTIELTSKSTQVSRRYYLNVTVVDTDSVDQIIDLGKIEPSQYQDAYTLWQTLPIGTRFGDPLVISDFDNDGLPEVSGSHFPDPDVDTLRIGIYEYTPDSLFKFVKFLDDSLERVIGSIPTDLDHDDLLELCIIRYGGAGMTNVEVSEEFGFPQEKQFVSHLYLLRGHNRLVDLDQDGWSDYITIGSEGFLDKPTYIAEYDLVSGNFVVRFKYEPQPFVSIYNYAVGDADGDGLLDAVGSSATGEIFFIENITDNQYGMFWSDTLSNSNASLMASTNDIDSNGKPEFIIGASGYIGDQGGTELFWYEASSDNQFEVVSRIFLAGAPFFGASTLYGYDLNGDDKEELVFDFDSMLLVLRANSDKQFEIMYATIFDIGGPEIEGITRDTTLFKGEYNLLVSVRDAQSSVSWKSFYYKQNPVTLLDPQDIPPSEESALQANYPNPFNSSSIIPFRLDVQQQVSLRILDISGRVVKSLFDNKVLSRGWYQVSWNGLDDRGNRVSSGLYLVHLRLRDQMFTRKALLLN